MTEPFFDFEWNVGADYRWTDWLNAKRRPVVPSDFDLMAPDTTKVFEVRAGKETGPVLTPVEGPGKRIRPMDRRNAGLFRTFASLDPLDLDGLISFAREYGFLGLPRQSQVISLPNGAIHYAEGECHLAWVNEIAMMKEALWLADHRSRAVKRRDKWEWLMNSHLQKVQGRIGIDANGGGQLRYAPTSLLSAMWLQLAQSVAGNKEFVKCKFCGRQIEISTAQTGFRTNREFCSDSCKTQESRKRKRQALSLSKKGVSLRVISKRTNTELDTVRRWVASIAIQTKRA